MSHLTIVPNFGYITLISIGLKIDIPSSTPTPERIEALQSSADIQKFTKLVRSSVELIFNVRPFFMARSLADSYKNIIGMFKSFCSLAGISSPILKFLCPKLHRLLLIQNL